MSLEMRGLKIVAMVSVQLLRSREVWQCFLSVILFLLMCSDGAFILYSVKTKRMGYVYRKEMSQPRKPSAEQPEAINKPRLVFV